MGPPAGFLILRDLGFLFGLSGSERLSPRRLAEAAQADEIAPLVGGALRWTELASALALGQETASAATSCGQTAELAVLHGVLADPVDARIVTDALVHRVDGNHLEPLVDGVLAHPIGVQHAKTTALAADALLSHAAEVASGLPLLDTLADRLAIHNALGDALLAATALDAHTVDDVALLGPVANTASLVWTAWLGGTMHSRKLTVLPVAQTRQEAHHVGLLSVPYLLDVLVGAHGSYSYLDNTFLYVRALFLLTHLSQ